MFAIDFISEIPNEDLFDGPVLLGEIVCGDLHETFASSFDTWSASDYRNAWKEQLGILLDGADAISLPTDLPHPTRAIIFRWNVYRHGSRVLVHQQIVLPTKDPDEGGPDRWRRVPPYSATGDDGVRLSEWSTSLHAVREFYDRVAIHW